MACVSNVKIECRVLNVTGQPNARRWRIPSSGGARTIQRHLDRADLVVRELADQVDEKQSHDVLRQMRRARDLDELESCNRTVLRRGAVGSLPSAAGSNARVVRRTRARCHSRSARNRARGNSVREGNWRRRVPKYGSPVSSTAAVSSRRTDVSGTRDSGSLPGTWSRPPASRMRAIVMPRASRARITAPTYPPMTVLLSPSTASSGDAAKLTTRWGKCDAADLSIDG